MFKVYDKKIDIQELKSIWSFEWTYITVGINGKWMFIIHKPYYQDNNLPDIPTYNEYTSKPGINIEDTILNRNLTINDLNKKIEKWSKDLKETVKILVELSIKTGANKVDEIFKLIWWKK